MSEKTGRVLRTIAIVILGLTAAMNILGGIGTTCAAFGFTMVYRRAFADLHDYKWLYQALVITTVLIGIAGAWATYALAKGKDKAYRNTLIILVIGSILAAVQFIASMTLRGEATPANVKFLINATTLVYFLVLRIPSIWQHINFSAPEDRVDGATQPIKFSGLLLVIGGVGVLAWVGVQVLRDELARAAAKKASQSITKDI
jgi:lysylphosphatidylglycerol synthetase-like protein (DUF2156 family)